MHVRSTPFPNAKDDVRRLNLTVGLDNDDWEYVLEEFNDANFAIASALRCSIKTVIRDNMTEDVNIYVENIKQKFNGKSYALHFLLYTSHFLSPTSYSISQSIRLTSGCILQTVYASPHIL